jgi:hypothetical protein
MQKILEVAIPAIMGLLIKTLKPEQIEKVADKALDWVEAAIAKSENKYDDEIVLPLIAIVRDAFKIEDNDGVAA